MYFIYCLISSLIMSISYEFSGLSGLGTKNVFLSFFIFLALSLIISRQNSKYKRNIVILVSFVSILSILNLIKVRFQLTEISFWDIKLMKAAGDIAGLFLDELPFFQIGFIVWLFLGFLFLTKKYDDIFKFLDEIIKIEDLDEIDIAISKSEEFLRYKFAKSVPVVLIVCFVVFAGQLASVFSTSSFGNLILSGRTLSETYLKSQEGDYLIRDEIKSKIKSDKLSLVDPDDELMKGYPFNETKDMDVVIIQSETFFDIAKYQKQLGKKGIKIKADDIHKNFHYYQDNGISGVFYTPTVGGGTVNTEYEVMTGYGAKYFQKGSIVFTSVLKKPTNSLGHFYKEKLKNSEIIGIHNHEASYWERDRVYPLLGIEKYVDMTMFTKEQQEDLVGAWMSDKTIFDRTVQELEQNKGKNSFVLSVTVQNHGPFLGHKEYIDVENLTEHDGWEIKNFVSNLKYSDDQLKIFMDYIDNRDKPTIVVFYGDHKPDANYDMFKDSKYYQENNKRKLYNTDYFIYFNKAIKDPKLRNLKGVKGNISAVSLNRYIQMLLGDKTEYTRYVYNYAKDEENYYDEEAISGVKASLFADISKNFINNKWEQEEFE